MSRWKESSRSLLIRFGPVALLTAGWVGVQQLAELKSPWAWPAGLAYLIALSTYTWGEVKARYRGKLFLAYDPVDFEGCRGPLPICKIRAQADNDAFIGHRLFDTSGQRYGRSTDNNMMVRIVPIEMTKGDDLVFEFLQKVGRGDATREDHRAVRAELRALFGIETTKGKPLPP